MSEPNWQEIARQAYERDRQEQAILDDVTLEPAPLTLMHFKEFRDAFERYNANTNNRNRTVIISTPPKDTMRAELAIMKKRLSVTHQFRDEADRKRYFALMKLVGR